MHIGRQNPMYQYQMDGLILKEDHERDIGVIVHNSLKPSKQCSEAARRENGVLGRYQDLSTSEIDIFLLTSISSLSVFIWNLMFPPGHHGHP